MAKGYIRGREAEGVHETHHHVMSVKTYLGVFAALMVLTVVTVLVSEADLGSAALVAALIVAFIKSGFVVGYFMHLKFDTRFHSFVFFGTMLFVAIFFLLTFLDINTRDATNPTHGNHTYSRDRGMNVPPPLVPLEEEGASGEITAPEPGAP